MYVHSCDLCITQHTLKIVVYRGRSATLLTCAAGPTQHSIDSSGELIHLELNLLKPIPSVQPRLWAIRGYGLLMIDLDLGANFALVASRTYRMGDMACGRYELCSTVS